MVAVKVIRRNDHMRSQGLREIGFLKVLAEADKHHTKHCIRLRSYFEFLGHLCLVFDPLEMNLRELLDKVGHGVGISLSAVRAYARQLLQALLLLSRLGLIHADIKPHNIVVSADFRRLELCDFGSAVREDDPDNVPTPLLVSRFYRAPEIILGLKPTPAIDLWSVGCVLFEIYTGDVLFPGEDNNGMLARMQQSRGPFPAKLLRRHLAQCETLPGLEAHFDADHKFLHTVRDPVTREVGVRPTRVLKATRDLRQVLLHKRASHEDKADVLEFHDFLDKILQLDPSRRTPVRDLIRHPFVLGRSSSSSSSGSSNSGGGGGGASSTGAATGGGSV